MYYILIFLDRIIISGSLFLKFKKKHQNKINLIHIWCNRTKKSVVIIFF